MTRRRFSGAVLAGLALSSAGCEALPYVLHLAEGQLRIQGEVEPLADVLASGRLSEDEQAKLELIVRAREFAATRLGLNVGDSYTTFYDSGSDPLAFNLSAARRDRLTPQTWTFPFVGEVPYLAFFDEDYLRDVQSDFERDGLDTYTYEVDAYSTLGVFADPVRSTMLRRNEVSLADTIIHELLHNTIWRPGDVNFNESLATFVGRTGAVQFLAEEFGADSGWPELAQALNEDSDRINAFLFELFHELETYYAAAPDAATAIAGREAVYAAGRARLAAEVLPGLNFPDRYAFYAELPTNNAWMLLNYRYNLDLDVFADVFAEVEGDWGRALAVYADAAAVRGDPFAYLRNWVAERATERLRR